MPTHKLDASQIRQFLKNLADKEWIKRSERRWWPQFLFHYTDIKNAASILRDGYLFSRKHAEENGKLSVSSGSSTILASTSPEIKSCVRLYFRPQTPTQFHAEGVLSQNVLSNSKYPDAHCPVPIFFLFDSAEVLSYEGGWFSDGGLGSRRAQKLSTAHELENLPWTKIYHIGRFDSRQEDIAFRRSAEVVVPNTLGLDTLRFIYCRSEAEKETLLYLLDANLRKKYKNKILATSRSNLFFRRHTFIQSARLSPKSADFDFSPETASPGPFRLKVNLEVGTQRGLFEKEDFVANTKLSVPFRHSFSQYKIHVSLDDFLVYANSFEAFEAPF